MAHLLNYSVFIPQKTMSGYIRNFHISLNNLYSIFSPKILGRNFPDIFAIYLLQFVLRLNILRLKQLGPLHLYSALEKQENRQQLTIHKRMNTLYSSKILFMKTSGCQGLTLRDMHCCPVVWMKSAVYWPWVVN